MTTKPFQVTTKGILGSLAVFLVAGACIRFGFWQLDRLDQKRTANAGLAARMDAAVVMLDGAPADTSGLRYRRAAARGTWDGERSIVLPGRSYRGAPGGHVLTPLRLAGGSAVLVVRGWAPAADGASVPLDAFAVAGTDSVTGLLDAFPGQSETLAARADRDTEDGFRRVWYAIDEHALRAQFPYPLADVTIRMARNPDRTDYPVALEPPALDAGPHLGYAIQWFSFAAIALIGWLAMLLRRRD